MVASAMAITSQAATQATTRAVSPTLAPRQPVYFKVTRRLDTSLLNVWQRLGYRWFCRRLPARFRVPAVPPLERGGFATLDEALRVCTSPDDQLRVLPFSWALNGESLDEDVVCRPRDPRDRARTMQLFARYADYDLRAAICSALAQENARLRRENEDFRALQSSWEKLQQRCEQL